MKIKVFSTLIIIAVFSILTASSYSSEKAADQQNGFMKVTDPQFIQKTVKLYNSLPDNKKTEIIDKMNQLSQERLKTLNAIKQKISELKDMELKLQSIDDNKAHINKLQTFKEYAIKQNATEVAKKLKNVIDLYENKTQ